MTAKPSAHQVYTYTLNRRNAPNQLNVDYSEVSKFLAVMKSDGR